MADDPGKNTADVPRPDTADTAHTAGGGDPSGNPDAPRGAPVPVPWYRRPLFWGIVLFLLVLALLGWLFWKQWQAAEAEKQAQEAALNAQLAKNAEMDAYLAQNGYVNDLNEKRLHHEIYLSDARKVAPEKWKTVIRHPIRRA